MSKLNKLTQKGLVSPPAFLRDNVQYECIMGSVAYGVSDDTSDVDIYGFAIPPKAILFPHTAGFIVGLDNNIPTFEQFQQHHIHDKETGKNYDIAIYSILKYFRLVMENNPNMIDSLFVPRHCILHSTELAELVREKRNMFLHKGAWHKFKGYAYAQVRKMHTKIPIAQSSRYESFQLYGYDIKFAYHVVRLLNEVEQILTEHTIDLQRNREQLKSIRAGEWSKEQITAYFERKELMLEELYNNSTLPHSPDVEAVKRLFLACLEMHYGSLADAVETKKDINMLVNDIRDVLEKYT